MASSKATEVSFVPQKPNGIRVYNVMFPVYMLFLLFPQVWLLALPFNFVFDSLVLLLAAGYLKVEGRKDLWKRSILRVWVYGFLADIAGAALITGIVLFLEEQLSVTVFLNPVYEILAALPGVALAGWLIYLLDRKWGFGKAAVDGAQRRRLALALAVFTAPYTMFLPTQLLYGGMR